MSVMVNNLNRKNIFSRLSLLIFNPNTFFINLKEKVDLKYPFLLLFLLMPTLFILRISKLKQAIIIQLQGVPSLTPEQIQSSIPMAHISSVIVLILLPAATCIFQSYIIYIIMNIWLIRTGKYNMVFSFCGYSYFPNFIKESLITGMVLTSEPGKLPYLTTSIILFFPEIDTMFWRLLLSQINPFIIWNLILISMGISIFYKVNLKKIILWVFFFWICYISIMLLISYVFRGMH